MLGSWPCPVADLRGSRGALLTAPQMSSPDRRPCRSSVRLAHVRALPRLAPTSAPSVFRQSFGAFVEPIQRMAAALEALRRGKTAPGSGQGG